MVCVWMVVALAAIDLAVNAAFAYPKDPKVRPNSLQAYFDYGRSTEGKLRRSVGPTPETSAPIVDAGWVDQEVTRPMSPRATSSRPSGKGDEITISSYGMSFSNQVAEAMADLDPRIRTRLLAGPGAPANHSFAAFRNDRDRSSRVAIFAVLASSVQGISTVTGATWMFEAPAPFTYPLFRATEAAPEATWPLVRTQQDLRTYLADPVKWNDYVAQLKTLDASYDPILFRASLIDSSALLRCLRRGYFNKVRNDLESRVHDSQGFNPKSDVIRSLRAMLVAFGAETRQAGRIPLVLLINNRGYADHLDRAVVPELQENRIPFISTYEIAPPTNVSNFLADGHFTHEANGRIARRTLDMILKLCAEAEKK